MNTQSYFILQNISNNFMRLLTNCTDTIFIPPTFTTINDITALIVLNQIIDLMYKKEKEYNMQNEIIGVTLEQIITIQCNHFCTYARSGCLPDGTLHRDLPCGDNTDFINSFYNYIQMVATTIIDNSVMKY